MLEFNVRFGDPETQALVPRIEDDLARAAARRRLRPPDARRDPLPPGRLRAPSRWPRAATRRTSENGVEITGCDAAEASDPDGRVQVFHAGTARRGDRLVTAGGRVLGVTALGDDLADARARAYAAADLIAFDGMQLRRDIAAAAAAAVEA